MDVVSFPKYRLNYRIESKKIKLNWCTNFTLSDVYSDLNAINIIANYVIHFKNCHFNGLQKKDFHFISVLQQLTIHDCTFKKPETQSIYVIATSNVQIQNTTIQNCDSNPLLLENIQKVDISNSFFKRCPRGLTLMNIADTNLDGCHFIENKELNYDGGAINSIGSGMQIRNCRFTENQARKGGAISATFTKNINIISSIFHENTALSAGTFYFSGGCRYICFIYRHKYHISK